MADFPPACSFQLSSFAQGDSVADVTNELYLNGIYAKQRSYSLGLKIVCFMRAAPGSTVGQSFLGSAIIMDFEVITIHSEAIHREHELMDGLFDDALYVFGKVGIGDFVVHLQACTDRALIWLLAHADSHDVNRLRFPAWITPDGGFKSSRPAWCYGDLGVAALLFQVGDGIGNLDVRAFASDMFETCLKLPIHLYRVQDAGLCHGASGVAHIYNRMYQLQGDSRFRDAALDWYERTLAMCRPGEGVGGYYKLAAWEGKSGWEPWPAFLDGSIGIALALLGAVTSIEPEWDRALLLSSRFSPANTKMGSGDLVGTQTASRMRTDEGSLRLARSY